MKRERERERERTRTHSVYKAVVAVLLCIQKSIFDEDGDCPQDKRHEQIHMDEVPGAVQLPVGRSNTLMYGKC